MDIWITVGLRHSLIGGSNPLMGKGNAVSFSENWIIFVALSKYSEILINWK